MKSNPIPLLDIALFHSNRSAFVEELRKACHNVGFFLLKHNISPSQLPNEVLEEGRQFFQRSQEEKNLISYENNPAFRGYMPLGVENTAGQLDHREQIEYAVEYPLHPDPSSSSSDVSNVYRNAWPAYHRLKSAPNPWPTSFQPSLKPKTMDYVRNVCQVADCLRDSLCLAMGLDPQVLTQKFDPSSLPIHNANIGIDRFRQDEVPHWVVKMVSYPTNDDHSNDDRSRSPSPIQGVGAHTDTNFLTLVLQDNEEDDDGGLQVFSQGEWIDVPKQHGSDVLICNLGEQAETWSRGYFLATPHRVLMKARRERSRISLPLFYNPCLSASMEPVEESSVKHLVWERPDPDASISGNGFSEAASPKKHWRRPNNTMLTSVGENTFKSLARSHPHVFAKHHPDLFILPDGKIVKKEI